MPDTTTRPWLCPQIDCPAGAHDTYSAYRQGCRSGAATEDYRLYYKRWRQGRHVARLANPVGIARRIEACYAVGHAGPDIGAALGVHRERVRQLRVMDRATMRTSAIARMAPVLERLAMTPGSSQRARSRAQRQGWRPLLAWDDIDDPTEQAPPAPDLSDQIAELASRGLTKEQVAKKLDVGEKTVRNRWPQVAVEVDAYAVDAVLMGRRHLLDCSDAEAEAVVERVFRDYLGEGWEKPGVKTAERLDVDWDVIRIIRNRIAKRHRPVKEKP